MEGVESLDRSPEELPGVEGHNPSLEELTATLSGWSPHYPTAALGTMELEIDDWADVGPGCGTLTSQVTAAQLRPGH